MKSRYGVLGAGLVILALPLAVVLSIPLGDAETILHFLLGLGFLTTAVAVFDFKVTRSVRWIGCLGIGGLGAIFIFQGISDIAGSDSLHDFAYDVLGQSPERVLPDLFIFWCVVMLFQDSRNKTRIFGFAVFALLIALEAIDYILVLTGGEAPEILKAFYLLAFVWLLLESRKPAELVDSLPT